MGYLYPRTSRHPALMLSLYGSSVYRAAADPGAECDPIPTTRYHITPSSFGSWRITTYVCLPIIYRD